MSGALEKAFLTFENAEGRLSCLFNPDSISLTASNKWEGDARPGKSAPDMKFGGQESRKLSFTLWFDTTDDGSPASNYTDELLRRMEIDPDLPGYDDVNKNGRPPWAQFHWGQTFPSFRAVITEAKISFEYFSADGVPLRAKVELSLTQALHERGFPRQNPTSGTPRPHRTHRVQRGETLDRISARYYGDSTQWRALAVANGIEDPLAIRPGSVIGIPKLDG